MTMTPYQIARLRNDRVLMLAFAALLEEGCHRETALKVRKRVDELDAEMRSLSESAR